MMDQRGRKITHVRDIFPSQSPSRPRTLRQSSSTSSLNGSPMMPRSPAGDPRRLLPDLPMHFTSVDSPMTSPTLHDSPLDGDISPGFGTSPVRRGIPSVPVSSFAQSTRRSAPSKPASPLALSSTDEIAPLVADEECEMEASLSISSSGSSSPVFVRTSFAEKLSNFQKNADKPVVKPKPSSSDHPLQRRNTTNTSTPPMARSFSYDCMNYGGDFLPSSSPSTTSTTSQMTRSMKAGSTGTAGSTGSDSSNSTDDSRTGPTSLEQFPGSEDFSEFLDDDDQDDYEMRRRRLEDRAELRRSVSHKPTTRDEDVSVLGKMLNRILRRSSSSAAPKRSVFNTSYRHSKQGLAENAGNVDFHTLRRPIAISGSKRK